MKIPPYIAPRIFSSDIPPKKNHPGNFPMKNFPIYEPSITANGRLVFTFVSVSSLTSRHSLLVCCALVRSSSKILIDYFDMHLSVFGIRFRIHAINFVLIRFVDVRLVTHRTREFFIFRRVMPIHHSFALSPQSYNSFVTQSLPPRTAATHRTAFAASLPSFHHHHHHHHFIRSVAVSNSAIQKRKPGS